MDFDLRRCGFGVVTLMVALVCSPTAFAQPLPPSPYDLVLIKKRLPSDYVITVVNNGAAINRRGKIEVVDLIPEGIYVGQITAPAPWQCTPMPPPALLGPDVITCTYPAYRIASGASLPDIVLRIDGRSTCPNCARVRLYLNQKRPGGGFTLVGDANPKDNAACTF